MKILLLNDNPVVNKLVTLSAQKTSDELDVVDSIEDINARSYDLLVVDDTSYSDEIFEKLKSKITFSESLYICSRDAKPVDEFTNTLKKPFLPTDLVELFSNIATKVDTINLDEDILGEEISLDDEAISLDTLEIDENEEISLDELSLDDEISSSESVLDNEEAQKVKDLLDETDNELTLDDELDFEEELKLEEEVSLEDEIESEQEEELSLDDISLEDEPEEELSLDGISLEDEPEEEPKEELSLGDEIEPQLEEELSLDDELEDELPKELDIESQIEKAVGELNEDDLNSEVNEETLLDIADIEINGLDSLTSKDLKLAIGEEVQEDEEPEPEMVQEIEETVNTQEDEKTLLEDETDKKNEQTGVEALKNLLSALNDKNVAASMKDMKININITIGDK